MIDETIFGNSLPEAAIKRARKTFSHYARRFGYDPQWSPRLSAVESEKAFSTFGIRTLVQSEDGIGLELPDPEDSLVIGTIRMGFGHYRIALAIASAAHYMDLKPYWLDFLSFPGTSPTNTIHHLESMYNTASRLSQRFKLFNRLVWEKVTSEVSQRLSYVPRDRELSRLYAPLCADLPKDIPFISTHPWTGQAAIHAGMERVVTAVPDNYPLAFHLVEGSMHAVQTPSSYLGYRSLRNMGEKGDYMLKPIPEDQIAYTGHFVDHEIVSNIDIDCERRFRRLHDHGSRRLLLTIGGAGAQVEQFLEIIEFCSEGLADGSLVLFVNMGDHSGRWMTIRTELELRKIPFVFHNEWTESRAFAEDARESRTRGLHVFLHSDTFPAVYLTNLLMRASDFMITKPSELAFYPVPKLFIQRVGRHEAWGAIRGAEIGDGTMETQSRGGLFQTLRLLLKNDDLLHLYCTNIVKNKEIGIYDGAYNAVKLALESRTRNDVGART